MDKTLVISGLLIGTAAGLVGALCGVGGGILMVPAFAMILKMDQKYAVATSLAIVVVTSVAGTMNHVITKSNYIDWRLVSFAALGAAVAAWFGTDVMKTLSSQTLSRIFGILMVVVGVRMLFPNDKAPEPQVPVADFGDSEGGSADSVPK